MARRLGDRHTLLYVLQFAATVALLVPEEERFAMMQRDASSWRGRSISALVLLQRLPAYITALLARGERAEAEAGCPSYDGCWRSSASRSTACAGCWCDAPVAACCAATSTGPSA